MTCNIVYGITVFQCFLKPISSVYLSEDTETSDFNCIVMQLPDPFPPIQHNGSVTSVFYTMSSLRDDPIFNQLQFQNECQNCALLFFVQEFCNLVVFSDTGAPTWDSLHDFCIFTNVFHGRFFGWRSSCYYHRFRNINSVLFCRSVVRSALDCTAIL